MPKLIEQYFPQISKQQMEQLELLGRELTDWNQKINLVSRKDIDNIFEHHILHSLVIAKIANFKSDELVVDIGTGGGLPGLPLAIMFPKTQFLLVDSIGKKVKVVKAIAEKLNLKNVKTMHCRAEDIPEKFDWAVCRAVGRLDEVWPLISNNFKPGVENNNDLPHGLFYLKGGDIASEMPAGANYKLWSLDELYKGIEYFESKSLLLLYKD